MTAPAPVRPIFNASFVASATAVLALVGWLVGSGALPVLEETPFVEELPGWGTVLFGAWMGAIVAVSLILPVLALAIWGRHASVRRALLPYVLVLAAQILVEATFARVFVPNVVVLTGLTYTSYRLWQLRASRRYFSAAETPTGPGRSLVGGLLALGLVFWAANLLFLLLIALPSVAAL